MSAGRTSHHPDLEALRRSEPAAPEAPRRPWLPRLTAAVLVLGILGAAYAVLRPVLFPPREVQVSSVRAVTGDGGPARTSAFVTAAGWIEAYPYPVTVRPLVKGVVEEVKVLEGTRVTKDETVIATLRNAEIENALIVAQAELELLEAARKKAATRLAVAESLLEQKIPQRSSVAQHQGELAAARASVGRARAARVAGEAALNTAEIDLVAQRDLERAGQATPTALARAEARVREANEKVAALRQAESVSAAEVAWHEAMLAIAKEAVADPRGLRGAVDEARAELERAVAAKAHGAAHLAVARRNADLLTIKAPMTGVVLRLEGAPGALAGPQGEFKGSGEGAGSTGLLNRMTGSICSLYDPQQLQVRVDVPYADLPGIEKGTAVEIEAKSLPGKRFAGVVDRLVREADITQAKLQVKVRIREPDEALTPEMICTARFLVQGAAAPGDKPAQGLRVQVPAQAVRENAVFVYDPTGGGRARRVAVRVIRVVEGWTEVEGDLGLATRVILEPVKDGEAVKVVN